LSGLGPFEGRYATLGIPIWEKRNRALTELLSSTLYNPKKPNENLLKKRCKQREFELLNHELSFVDAAKVKHFLN
jgi:hypothetical protein